MSLPFSNIKERIIYIASLLDGEGTFDLHKGKYPRFTVEMKDLDIIQRIRDIMSFSTNIRTQKPRKFNHSTTYVVTINGQRAAEWMMTIYCLMSNRRKEEIRKVLIGWKAHQLIDKVTQGKMGSKARQARPDAIKATWGENISRGRKNSQAVRAIMSSKNVSEPEAKKLLEEWLSSAKQTVKEIENG